MTDGGTPQGTGAPAGPRTPPRWLVKSFWVGHRAVYRLSGGRFGLRRVKPGGSGMLRLQTLGRRSGEVRSAIVGYIEDGDAVIVLLRRTFGAFEAAERRQLMTVLMGLGVEHTTGFGVDVDPARSASALATVRRMLGLPDAAELVP